MMVEGAHTRTTQRQEEEEEEEEEDRGEEEMASMLASSQQDQESAPADGAIPFGDNLPTSHAVTHDPMLHRQILQEHFLRTSLLSPAQQQQSSLLSLAGVAPTANSLYQELLARVSLAHRDVLPLLAANLNSLPLSNDVAMAQQQPQAAAVMPTLASLVSPTNPAAASTSISKPPSYVVGTPMQMIAPHSMSENALVNPAPEAEETRKNVDYHPYHNGDYTDTEASAEHAAAPKDGRGRGEWSMLDILAATASAARLEVGTD